MTDPTTGQDDTPPAGPATLLNRPDRLGVAALVVALLGGLWVMAAPFIVGYQGRTAHWTHGTIDALAVGGGVALLALTGLVVLVAGMLAELSRAHRAPARVDTEAPAAGH